MTFGAGTSQPWEAEALHPQTIARFLPRMALPRKKTNKLGRHGFDFSPDPIDEHKDGDIPAELQQLEQQEHRANAVKLDLIHGA